MVSSAVSSEFSAHKDAFTVSHVDFVAICTLCDVANLTRFTSAMFSVQVFVSTASQIAENLFKRNGSIVAFK